FRSGVWMGRTRDRRPHLARSEASRAQHLGTSSRGYAALKWGPTECGQFLHTPGPFLCRTDSHSGCFLTKIRGTLSLARGEEAEVLPAAYPFAEHVFGVDALAESRLAGFDGAHQHRRRRLSEAIREHRISKLK